MNTFDQWHRGYHGRRILALPRFREKGLRARCTRRRHKYNQADDQTVLSDLQGQAAVVFQNLDDHWSHEPPR
jgi:hypothetical protein